MKRFKLTFAVPVLAALIVFGIAAALVSQQSNGATDDKKTNSPKPALTITTARPQTTPMPIRLAANGNIAAWQEASIGSESNGLRLAEIHVNVGDQVRAGQVLAIFDSESVAADVAQARAGVMEAEANAAEAAANAARARTLQKTGALSEQEIAQYLTMEQTAKAKAEAARATLTVQKLRMKHVQVVAPDDGIISARSATVGAVVPAGTELFRMIRRGRLEWRAEVTSSELGRIKVGTPVTIVAVNGSELKGKVRVVGPTVDLQNRVAIVYVDLAAPAGNTPPAKAGMYARGEFDLGTSSALTVPQQSVVLREGFSYLFRLTPDNRVQQVKIKTGRRIADRIEVLEGLKPDALVAVNGAGFLNDGDLVRVSTNAQAVAAK